MYQVKLRSGCSRVAPTFGSIASIMAQAPRPDSAKAVGIRLRLIRLAYGMLQGHIKPISQKDFSALCGANRQAWNNAETGDSRIGLDAALGIRKRTGVGLNYIYEGDQRDLPHAFAVAIAKLDQAESPSRATSRR
jgi:transcriptional regulator with XRE-family HTH domain